MSLLCNNLTDLEFFNCDEVEDDIVNPHAPEYSFSTLQLQRIQHVSQQESTNYGYDLFVSALQALQ